MGKAITEIDSYAGPMSGTTKLPVSDSDTLQAGTASQVLAYIVANLGNAATKNTGATAGTVAAGDHTHSSYAATGAIGSSGLTMATAKLLGRSTAGTGAPEEITLGTNLSFSGTTLNAAGGGGSPAGSDMYVQFNDGGAFGGDSGLTFNKTTKALSVGGATVTTSNPVLNLTQTWNAGAITFTGFKLNITDTASASGSLPMDVQVGGSSKLSLTKAGHLTVPSLTVSGSGNTAYFSGNAAVVVNITWANGWGTLAGNSSLLNIYTAGSAPINIGGNSTRVMIGNTAGEVEVNNGTVGTYRDLKARNIVASGGVVTHASFTVSTLPSASTSGAGAQAFVTDANATTARSTVAGGGSNKVNVFSDGTNWLIAA